MTTANEKVSALDQRSFHDALDHHPIGLFTLASIDDVSAPIVLVVRSLTSVSLDHSLAGPLPTNRLTRWPWIEQAPEFYANILGADQGDVCCKLLATDPEAYALIPDGVSQHGLSTIAGAIEWMDCHASAVKDASDHVMPLADVVDLGKQHGDATSGALQGCTASLTATVHSAH